MNNKLRNEVNHCLEKLARLPEADPETRRALYSLEGQIVKNGDLSEAALKLFRDLQRKIDRQS